jgi:hypothetical protein
MEDNRPLPPGVVDVLETRWESNYDGRHFHNVERDFAYTLSRNGDGMLVSFDLSEDDNSGTTSGLLLIIEDPDTNERVGAAFTVYLPPYCDENYDATISFSHLFDPEDIEKEAAGYLRNAVNNALERIREHAGAEDIVKEIVAKW